jgi:hypothetical protein
VIFIKTYIPFIIFNLIIFCNFGTTQESYLIKKKIKDKSDISTIQKKNNISPTTEKKVINSIKKNNNSVKKNLKNVNAKTENSIRLKDKKLRVVYKPNQKNLNQDAIIKIIEISDNLNKENILTVKSYASKNTNQGSSEARRLSLSRALEIRSLFIENNFPATNIFVRALGAENNNEGFTDIVIVEIN